MRTGIPASIAVSAVDLAPSGLVSLYRLTLKNGTVFRMSPKTEVTWQGGLFEAIPCVMTELQIEADGKANRPTFSFANPEGMFTQYLYGGLLENAELRRYRLLYSDLLANNNFAVTETLRVAQILTVTKQLIAVQLRDVYDGHSFMLPARAYYPPEFPHVKL